jgi:hypothetical protein
MKFVYFGILAASIFAAWISWLKHRSHVVVHNIDYTGETLTVKNTGDAGALSVRLYVAMDEKGIEDALQSSPGDYTFKGKRLRDIPAGGQRTVDLNFINFEKELRQADTVCVAAKWEPDWWADCTIKNDWRSTSVTVPGYHSSVGE